MPYVSTFPLIHMIFLLTLIFFDKGKPCQYNKMQIISRLGIFLYSRCRRASTSIKNPGLTRIIRAKLVIMFCLLLFYFKGFQLLNCPLDHSSLIFKFIFNILRHFFIIYSLIIGINCFMLPCFCSIHNSRDIIF
jgi:hypothetical protein